MQQVSVTTAYTGVNIYRFFSSSDINQSNILYIYIQPDENKCLNNGCVHHRAGLAGIA